MLDSTHFDHNNGWVHWTVGTSSGSHPRRHRAPIALTQTLGLSQARPPAVPCVDFSHLLRRPPAVPCVDFSHLLRRPPVVPCVDFSHLTGRPQSKHVLSATNVKLSSHNEAAVRCSTQFDHNDECAGLSARISITTINEFRSRTSLLFLRKREASAVEPVTGVSEVGRRLRPRWTFFCRHRFSNLKTSD